MLERKDPVTVWCGRPISRREIDEIRETVGLFGNLSQKELSNTICEHLDWRTPSGTNKWTACLKLLKKFEQQGLITLPRKKVQAKPKKKIICHSPETDPGSPIETNLSRISPVTLAIAQTGKEVRLWNELVHRYHYLGFHKPFGYTLRYFIRHEETLLGCALFSGAAKAISPRDSWIGWHPFQRLQNLSRVVNNSRFLIFPWVRVKNLASHVLGKLHRNLSRDWETKWGFPPLLLETFVDPARFRGSCYKAANWTCLGLTTGKGLARKGKSYRTSRKMIFVKPLSKDFREHLCTDMRQNDIYHPP